MRGRQSELEALKFLAYLGTRKGLTLSNFASEVSFLTSL